MEKGWIKLHRELLDKAIWTGSTPEQCKLLITLLCEVNHKSQQWVWKGQKFDIKPGQMITSLSSLAKKARVSIKNVRTGIANFQKLEFLANESAKTGRLITILNWDTYQSNEIEGGKANGKEVAKRGQLLKNIKNVKKDYTEQILISKNNKKYTELVDFLFGKNPFEEELTALLLLPKQILWKNFVGLARKAEEKNKNIHDLIISLYNDPKYYKGKKSLPGILNTWIARK